MFRSKILEENCRIDDMKETEKISLQFKIMKLKTSISHRWWDEIRWIIAKRDNLEKNGTECQNKLNK